MPCINATKHHSFQIFICKVYNISPKLSKNRWQIFTVLFQCPALMGEWPLDRSNLIRLGLTNNSCQNVSASCDKDRSWICHIGIQVKQSDMASPSNTRLRTLISFMTFPNPCLHHSAGPGLLYMANSYDKGNSIYHKMFAIYYTILCFIISDF